MAGGIPTSFLGRAIAPILPPSIFSLPLDAQDRQDSFFLCDTARGPQLFPIFLLRLAFGSLFAKGFPPCKSPSCSDRFPFLYLCLFSDLVIQNAPPPPPLSFDFSSVSQDFRTVSLTLRGILSIAEKVVSPPSIAFPFLPLKITFPPVLFYPDHCPACALTGLSYVCAVRQLLALTRSPGH